MRCLFVAVAAQRFFQPSLRGANPSYATMNMAEVQVQAPFIGARSPYVQPVVIQRQAPGTADWINANPIASCVAVAGLAFFATNRLSALAVRAKPAAKKPVARKPVARKPVAKKPMAKTGGGGGLFGAFGASKPAAKKPVARKPVARKPVARKPVAKKPVAKTGGGGGLFGAFGASKPAAKKPVARRPVARPAQRGVAKKDAGSGPPKLISFAANTLGGFATSPFKSAPSRSGSRAAQKSTSGVQVQDTFLRFAVIWVGFFGIYVAFNLTAGSAANF
jgi:hypothetical protein